MIVLLSFAFIAGAGTALSPCVLPVLPALLSAGGVGGRRRPLGIVIGLSVTFTVVIVGAAKVVDGVGLGSDPLRGLAIAVLIIFGLALVLPGELTARLEAPLSRLARFGPRSGGTGFGSGLLVGELSASSTPPAPARSSRRSYRSGPPPGKPSRSPSPMRSARPWSCSPSPSAGDGCSSG